MIYNNPTWFRSTVALAANTAENVFTAAANARGAWITSAYSVGRVAAGTVPYVELAWGTTAPTAINNRNTIIAVTQVQLVETAGIDSGRFSFVTPYFVPAGNGLWFFNVVVQAGTNARSVGYQLL